VDPAATVVFFHAHPDDEAIFTGGTMRLLADRGHRVVLVVATRGEQGLASAHGQDLGLVREGETRDAAASLGVTSVHFLGYADSGLRVDEADASTAFATAPADEAAGRLAAVLRDEEAVALVSYDETGIYGHPDHVQLHRVGARAAEIAGIATRYDATVDREYLHFVETHLVEEAGQAISVPVGPLDGADAPFAPSLTNPPDHASLGLAATALGLPSVLIDCLIDVRSVIDAKRTAMLAHASQIPSSSSAMQLTDDAFAEVYGYEWFARFGTPGPIDDLAG
jgi:LmbE family N-acetylglucosaminyl deacetylase